MDHIRTYPLDNSAIIHLAAMKKWHTNSFRLAVTLTEKVDPEVLQSALDKIIFRFPTIAAGIREGVFKHKIIPIKKAPRVKYEQKILTCMSKREIATCAFRVLYYENQIAAEFFHSLTDGYGGTVFLNSLLAEYLNQLHNVPIVTSPMILSASETPNNEEITDDYFTYAGAQKAKLNHRRVYQLPGKTTVKSQLQVTTHIYHTQELLDLAHRYQSSLTTFLTAVMAFSVAEIQQNHSSTGRCKKPIQIMVPVNLRKLFPSKTLRNFSLFALPCIEAREANMPFEHILSIIQKRLKKQTARDNMAAMMTTHTKLEKMPLLQIIPWKLKEFVLKIAHHLCGEQNSCISLSNLGVIAFPSGMGKYIEQIDLTLTPRMKSPYNCGVISYGEQCIITISRFCEDAELEKHFFCNLSRLLIYKV